MAVPMERAERFASRSNSRDRAYSTKTWPRRFIWETSSL